MMCKMKCLKSLLLAVPGALLASCVSQGGAQNNKYVLSPVTDTLTVLLPNSEDEFCQIKIYGNGANFMASDYVIGGCVKFCVSSIPGGRHRILIHAGDVVADESFNKR
jgi:hypothetical protein